MSKMTFGEWVGINIRGAAGNGKVMRINAGLFNVDGLVRIAESIDRTALMAQLEGRKLTALESFGIEVLITLCGWKDLAEGHEAFKKHLEREANR